MVNRGRKASHVPDRYGTGSDVDILLDFDCRMKKGRHSKYLKKTLKELRQKTSDIAEEDLSGY